MGSRIRSRIQRPGQTRREGYLEWEEGLCGGGVLCRPGRRWRMRSFEFVGEGFLEWLCG